MHSACHQVEEGTVLKVTHYSHPSIVATSATIHRYMTMATTLPLPREELCHYRENKLSNSPNPPLLKGGKGGFFVSTGLNPCGIKLPPYFV